MPRLRGTNFAALLAILGVVFLLWMLAESPSRSSSYRDYRKKTESAMLMKEHMTKMGKEYLSDSDMLSKTNSELKGILKQQYEDSRASDNVAEVKGALKDDLYNAKEVQQAEVEEVSVAGRKKMPKQKTGDYDAEPARYPTEEDEDLIKSSKSKNDPGREAAREELQRILKRSPIVIFSKSTCPYSKRAKNLLLNTYKITPAPFVVELDLMIEPAPTDDDSSSVVPATMGRKLQDLLAEITGRKTVPNVMVGGVMKSLGGSDEMTALDDEGKLEETLKKYGGRQIVEVRRRMEG